MVMEGRSHSMTVKLYLYYSSLSEIIYKILIYNIDILLKIFTYYSLDTKATYF